MIPSEYWTIVLFKVHECNDHTSGRRSGGCGALLSLISILQSCISILLSLISILLSCISILLSHISILLSCISILLSCISILQSCISILLSRISILQSCISILLSHISILLSLITTGPPVLCVMCEVSHFQHKTTGAQGPPPLLCCPGWQGGPSGVLRVLWGTPTECLFHGGSSQRSLLLTGTHLHWWVLLNHTNRLDGSFLNFYY